MYNEVRKIYFELDEDDELTIAEGSFINGSGSAYAYGHFDKDYVLSTKDIEQSILIMIEGLTSDELYDLLEKIERIRN